VFSRGFSGFGIFTLVIGDLLPNVALYQAEPHLDIRFCFVTGGARDLYVPNGRVALVGVREEALCQAQAHLGHTRCNYSMEAFFCQYFFEKRLPGEGGKESANY